MPNLSKQTAKLLARILENMPSLTGDEMQYWIERPVELQAALSQVFRREQQVNLTLDCSQPFNPAEFIDKGCSVWLGPIDGDGLSGEPDIDPRADSLVSVDFEKSLFEHCLKKGESSITGEETIRRLKERESEVIRLGGQQFQALWNDWKENEKNSVLEHLRKMHRITYMVFPGFILRSPDGHRFVLYLFWDEGGWDWHYRWLDRNWVDRRLSVSFPAS